MYAEGTEARRHEGGRKARRGGMYAEGTPPEVGTKGAEAVGWVEAWLF